MSSVKHIKCPKCGKGIDLKSVLYDELKADFDDALTDEINKRTEDLNTQTKKLAEELHSAMEANGTAKAEVLKLQAKLASSEKMKDMEFEQLLLKEGERIRSEVWDKVSQYKQSLDENSSLRLKESEDTIRQLKKQLEIAHQKATQGSMQSQGEAQELLVEEFLKETFPLDTISEIKKGAMGADVLQIINTRTDLGVGSIYYESKRTKTFNNAWIDKFKQDMIAKGADVGVLISSARPTNIDRAENIKGVWVCTLEEFKVLSQALRNGVVSIFEIKVFNENKSDKMTMLYSYLTSNEFKMQVDAIVEGFSQMQEDLESEKRAMKSIWSKREKQIVRVLDNTINMHGSIRGIAGPAVDEIPSLELR